MSLLTFSSMIVELLCCRVRDNLKAHVGDVEAAAVPCGFGRAIGNKVFPVLVCCTGLNCMVLTWVMSIFCFTDIMSKKCFLPSYRCHHPKEGEGGERSGGGGREKLFPQA